MTGRCCDRQLLRPERDGFARCVICGAEVAVTCGACGAPVPFDRQRDGLRTCRVECGKRFFQAERELRRTHAREKRFEDHNRRGTSGPLGPALAALEEQAEEYESGYAAGEDDR